MERRPQNWKRAKCMVSASSSVKLFQNVVTKNKDIHPLLVPHESYSQTTYSPPAPTTDTDRPHRPHQDYGQGTVQNGGQARREGEFDRFVCEQEVQEGGERAQWEGQLWEVPAPLSEVERRERAAGLRGVVCSSDAFFPFADNVYRARKSGVRYLTVPNGGVMDEECIKAADEHGLLVFRFPVLDPHPAMVRVENPENISGCRGAFILTSRYSNTHGGVGAKRRRLRDVSPNLGNLNDVMLSLPLSSPSQSTDDLDTRRCLFSRPAALAGVARTQARGRTVEVPQMKRNVGQKLGLQY